MPAPLPQSVESLPFDGLTSKQWQFAQAVYSGATESAAYRQVYNPGPDVSEISVARRASELMHNPKVAAKIMSMRRETEAKATLAPLVTRDFVLNGIMQIATQGDKDSTRLRAFELLGKTVGVDLFREHVVTTKEERTVADIERELRDKLQSLRQTIDGTATPLPPDAAAPQRKRKPRT